MKSLSVAMETWERYFEVKCTQENLENLYKRLRVATKKLKRAFKIIFNTIFYLNQTQNEKIGILKGTKSILHNF